MRRRREITLDLDNNGRHAALDLAARGGNRFPNLQQWAIVCPNTTHLSWALKLSRLQLEGLRCRHARPPALIHSTQAYDLQPYASGDATLRLTVPWSGVH